MCKSFRWNYGCFFSRSPCFVCRNKLSSLVYGCRWLGETKAELSKWVITKYVRWFTPVAIETWNVVNVGYRSNFPNKTIIYKWQSMVWHKFRWKNNVVKTQPYDYALHWWVLCSYWIFLTIISQLMPFFVVVYSVEFPKTNFKKKGKYLYAKHQSYQFNCNPITSAFMWRLNDLADHFHWGSQYLQMKKRIQF